LELDSQTAFHKQTALEIRFKSPESFEPAC